MITSRHLQVCLASVFLVLGAWCVFTPSIVESVTLRPEFITGSPQMTLMIACFGAQAVLGGVVILFSRFTPLTFLVFGLVGSVPFFGFNAWFYFIDPILNEWMLLDFVGNIVILISGIWGYKLRKKELETAQT